MTPFQIRWTFSKLPEPTTQRPAELLERIKRLYFEDAGRRWAYVLRGWPLRADNTVLRLPAGQPFTYLEIEVVFEAFGRAQTQAVARVPAESIRQLESSPSQPTRFPYFGQIRIDLNDLDALLNDRARFFDTVVHEVGHVLGLGTAWRSENPRPLIRTTTTGNVVYCGTVACREYAVATGHPYGTLLDIPLDREVNGTTAAYHWDEEALRFEIMSSSLDTPTAGNPASAGSNVISRISAGALRDLGYVVDLEQAQRLPLPQAPDAAPGPVPEADLPTAA